MAVDARLKWPNDVIVEDRKLAGILVEKVEDGLVVGVGLNVGLRKDELPVPTATSLAIEGAAERPGAAAARDPAGVRDLVPGVDGARR